MSDDTNKPKKEIGTTPRLRSGTFNEESGKRIVRLIETTKEAEQTKKK